MLFAIVDTTGKIQQINESLDNSETLVEINNRLEGKLAIECGSEVMLDYTWNSTTGLFEPPG